MAHDVLVRTMRPLYATWITKYVNVREKQNSGRNMQWPIIDNLAMCFLFLIRFFKIARLITIVFRLSMTRRSLYRAS